jgi:dihydroflavonol-4-reductase
MDLVTGATGHIGNVLVRQLLAQGRQVRVLLRGDSLPPALEGLDVDIARGDLLNPPSLENAMRGVEVIYHLAARISLLAGPDPETERVNQEGTSNILAAFRLSRARRLVYVSSIYALKKPPEGMPIDESQPFEAAESQGPYDASKARASLEVLKAASEGLDVVIVCPTAVTGPFDFHESEMGRAIRLYMRPGIKFLIDGAYDFVDVRDTARGCILAAEKGRRGENYILGGERLTMQDVTQVVWQEAGTWHASVRVPLAIASLVARLMPLYCAVTGARPLFTRYSLGAVTSNSHISHAKASRELGYSPRPARQAIAASVRWFQAQRKGVPYPEIESEVAIS